MKQPRILSHDLQTPHWLGDIGDLPDHYHGFSWGDRVMPNNLIFFLRQSVDEMIPGSVSHCLHDRYEIVVPYQGEGQVCVEDKLYKLCPGQVLLIAPGTFHYFLNLPEEGFSWLFCTFELDSRTMHHNSLKAAPRELSVDDLEQISQAGALYVNPGINELSVFEVGLRFGRIIQSLYTKKESLPDSTATEENIEVCQLLRTVTRFVSQHMDQTIRIDDIASHLDKSDSYLRKVFRERFGCSLGRYLQKSRLTRSVQLIDKNDQSISEIARLCGFESIHSFSQSFSRAIGMSPTAYRQHLLSKRPPIKIASRQLAVQK